MSNVVGCTGKPFLPRADDLRSNGHVTLIVAQVTLFELYFEVERVVRYESPKSPGSIMPTVMWRLVRPARSGGQRSPR